MILTIFNGNFLITFSWWILHKFQSLNQIFIIFIIFLLPLWEIYTNIVHKTNKSSLTTRRMFLKIIRYFLYLLWWGTPCRVTSRPKRTYLLFWFLWTFEFDFHLLNRVLMVFVKRQGFSRRKISFFWKLFFVQLNPIMKYTSFVKTVFSHRVSLNISQHFFTIQRQNLFELIGQHRTLWF